MPLDLAALTSTPDIRCIPHTQARLVGAFRYTHIARRSGRYCDGDLARYLGGRRVIAAFHRFADEVGRSWPEPIMLNPPCQPACSYDEMLILDVTAAAANGDRGSFDAFLVDMVSARSREGIWRASRRLMARMARA